MEVPFIYGKIAIEKIFAIVRKKLLTWFSTSHR